MSLSRKTAAAVDTLILREESPSSIVVEDGTDRLTMTVQIATKVGIQCELLEFTRQGIAEQSLDELKAWGNRLAGQLTYLMERVVIMEADEQSKQVILRSQIPTSRHGHRSYFEIVLGSPCTLRLSRKVFDEAERRRHSDSFQLTLEVLERLADDLAGTAA